jgi:hypothetical protein
MSKGERLKFVTFSKVTKLLHIWYELFWINVHTSVWQQAIISKQQIGSKIIKCFKNYAAMKTSVASSLQLQ